MMQQRLSDHLLAFVLVVTGVATLGLMAGFPVSRAQWLGIAAIQGAICLRGRPLREGARDIAALLALLLGTTWLAGFFPDLSWDGQWYHQEAILRFLQGWNPVRHLVDRALAPESFWFTYWQVIAYPKAAWLYGAELAKLTGALETAKQVNLLLAIGAFLTAWHRIRAEFRLDRLRSGVAALALASSPIVFTQLFTFYVDGALASGLLILACAALGFVRRPGAGDLARMGAAWILVMNLKTTGLVYGGGLVLAAGALTLARRARRVPEAGQWLRRWAVASGMALALGVGFFGYTSYVTNLVAYRNPVFPFASLKPGPAFEREIPKTYAATPSAPKPPGRLESFVLSNRGCATSDPDPGAYVLKRPFELCPREAEAYWVPDARHGGFGPFFGAACLLALSALGWLLVRHPVSGRRALIATAALLALVLVNPHPWWARLSPHAYWLPWIPLLALLKLRTERSARLATAALLATLALNLGIVAQASLHHQWEGRLARQQELRTLAALPQPIEVAMYFFQSARDRLDRAGIRYRRVKRGALSCLRPIELWWSPIRVCPASTEPHAPHAEVAFSDRSR